MLTLGPHQFEIARTQFEAYIHVTEAGWAASWNMEIEAKPKDIGGQLWQPHLQSHMPLHLPHPTALVGTTLGPLPTEDEEPPFLLYIFEHDPVVDPILHFSERKGAAFRFRFEGITPAWGLDLEAEGNVPLRVDCWLPFDGVVVDELYEEKARKRLDQVFGLGSWKHFSVRGFQHIYRLEE